LNINILLNFFVR